METNQAATQPGQETAAPTTTESAPVETTTETPKVETVKADTNAEPEWFTKRFGEITAKYRETERRAIAAEQRLSQIEQERLQRERQAPPEKLKTLDDFGFDAEKYQAYLFEQTDKRTKEAARLALAEEKSAENAAKRARKFKEREVAFEKETPDYREIAHYAPISDDVAEILQDLDSGPELAYYLGKNRDVALSINDLPPHIAAVELGRIDAKLTSERAAKAAALEKAKQDKAVSKAPPPTPKLEGSNAQVEKDPSEMTDKQFAEWRRKQIAARGK